MDLSHWSRWYKKTLIAGNKEALQQKLSFVHLTNIYVVPVYISGVWKTKLNKARSLQPSEEDRHTKRVRKKWRGKKREENMECFWNNRRSS